MDRLRQMREKYEVMTGENSKRDKKTKDLEAVTSGLVEKTKQIVL